MFFHVVHRRISKGLGGLKVQFLELAQLLQLLDALVGDQRERQIEPLHGGDVRDITEVFVGGPRARQRHLGNAAVAIAHHEAAARVYAINGALNGRRLGGAGLWRRERLRRRRMRAERRECCCQYRLVSSFFSLSWGPTPTTCHRLARCISGFAGRRLIATSFFLVQDLVTHHYHCSFAPPPRPATARAR
jgi:hypothetical protein